MTLPTPARLFAVASLLLASGSIAHAQISLSTAVDLALTSSPRVRMAEADVAHARAALQEASDAYIPSVTAASSALGYSKGFPLGLPTVASVQAQSLVFNFSQKDYIRAARSGYDASRLAAEDVREQVAEDAVLAYLALDREQQQRAALLDETGYAQRLETIVKERLDAGQDSAMEYTKARRTNVQLRLQLLQLDDQIAVDRDHLTRIIGLPSTKIAVIDSSIPSQASTVSSADMAAVAETDSPGIRAAVANAHAKREQAFGDARFLYRPQLGFGASYNRFSTYNNNYGTYYPGIVSQPNAVGFELSITLPLFDKVRQARARETMAEAVHAEQQVQIDRQQFFEGRLKIRHSIAELQAKAELASLDRDLAQEQLQVVLVQLQSNPAGGPPITPKDEQNARIQERQRTIDMLDAEFQLRQAEVSLLRQTGGLGDWLKQAGLLGSAPASTPASPLPPAPTPVPNPLEK